MINSCTLRPIVLTIPALVALAGMHGPASAQSLWDRGGGDLRDSWREIVHSSPPFRLGEITVSLGDWWLRNVARPVGVTSHRIAIPREEGRWARATLVGDHKITLTWSLSADAAGTMKADRWGGDRQRHFGLMASDPQALNAHDVMPHMGFRERLIGLSMGQFRDRSRQAGIAMKQANIAGDVRVARLHAFVPAAVPRRMPARDMDGSTHQDAEALNQAGAKVMQVHASIDAMLHVRPADFASSPLGDGWPPKPAGESPSGGHMYIVGDSMALGVEQDVQGALAQRGIRMPLKDIRNYAKGASGVSHDAFENWPARAREIGAKLKSGDTVLVAGLGHNDFPVPRQDARYQDKYFKRYEDVLRHLKKEGARLIVAAPAPFLEPGGGGGGYARRAYVTAKWSIPQLSRRYREIAARVGAEFIDPAARPDMHARHLRQGDGLHWAGAGRKAFANMLVAQIAHSERQLDVPPLDVSTVVALGLQPAPAAQSKPASPRDAARRASSGYLAKFHDDPHLRHLLQTGQLPKYLQAMEGKRRLPRGELKSFQASLSRAGIHDSAGRSILVDDIVGPQMRGVARQLRSEAGDLQWQSARATPQQPACSAGC